MGPFFFALYEPRATAFLRLRPALGFCPLFLFRPDEGDSVAQARRSFRRLQFVPCQKVGERTLVQILRSAWVCEDFRDFFLRTIASHASTLGDVEHPSPEKPYPLRAGTAP